MIEEEEIVMREQHDRDMRYGKMIKLNKNKKQFLCGSM